MAQHLWIPGMYLHRSALGFGIPVPLPSGEGLALRLGRADHLGSFHVSSSTMQICLANADLQRLFEVENKWKKIRKLFRDWRKASGRMFFYPFDPSIDDIESFNLVGDRSICCLASWGQEHWSFQVGRGGFHESRALTESGALAA